LTIEWEAAPEFTGVVAAGSALKGSAKELLIGFLGLEVVYRFQ
jgi:hypothetical protein